MVPPLGRDGRGLCIVEVVLTEWLSVIIRWPHVVAGIAWIGSSFYFIHLDLSLKARAGPAAGRQGRCLAGPWRRLLPHDQVSGRAVPDARRPDLVQVGGLCHLALRLRPPGHRLLLRRRPVPDRQERPRPDGADGSRLAFGTLVIFLAVLRGAVPLAARPATKASWRCCGMSSWSPSPTASPMCSPAAARSRRSAR